MSRDPLELLVVVTLWGQPSETFVRREADAAAASGARVTILSLRPPVADGPDGSTVHYLAPLVVATGALGTMARHPIRVARVVGRIIRRAAPRNLGMHLAAAAVGFSAARRLGPIDVPHAHFAWLSATTADAIAAVRGTPFSVFPHAFDVFEHRVVDGYLADKLERAAVVAVESPTMEAELASRYSCTPDVVRVGIEAAWLRPEPRPPVRDGLRTVLSVGMLREKKGHDLLLRAVAGIPDCQAVIVGDGPERSSLEAEADALGVRDRVRFAGLLAPDEIRQLLDESAVFALASRTAADGDRDGIPNVLIEALGRSVPAVSTMVSGIPDLLADGRGVLVPADDADALGRAVCALLDDPASAARIGAAGWAHIRDNYVAETNWSHLESLLREAIR